MSFERTPSIGFLTNRAARLLVHSLDVRLNRLGMRPAHMPVFVALCGGREMTQKELAERAQIEQPTMAATLGRMEEAGLIERRPDPKDRRSMLIGLSEAAEAQMPAVNTIVAEVTAVAERDFEEGDDERYRSLLMRLIGALEADPMR